MNNIFIKNIFYDAVGIKAYIYPPSQIIEYSFRDDDTFYLYLTDFYNISDSLLSNLVCLFFKIFSCCSLPPIKIFKILKENISLKYIRIKFIISIKSPHYFFPLQQNLLIQCIIFHYTFPVYVFFSIETDNCNSRPNSFHEPSFYKMS